MGLIVGAYKGTIIGSRRQFTDWYGVEINEANSSPDCARIASNMNLHATLPVQNLMRGCLLADDGTVNYYLKSDDWTKKADGTASNLDGTDGQVMVEVPTYYRKVDNPSTGVYQHKISLSPVAGFTKVNGFFYAAYEAALQRSTSKLTSVKNLTTDYRGGNNTAAWDAAANTLLGRPATSISLTNYRTYARNRGSNKWNVTTWRADMLVWELIMIEYATLNSNKSVNGTLTVDGYKQGCLGEGVTTANSTEWNNFSAYNPFIPCGASDNLANASGEVSRVVTNFGGSGVNRTFTIPRYRGIENPFGHIWKWCDGASVYHEGSGGASKFYTCDNPANFADGTATNYEHRANLPTASTYLKFMTHDDVVIFIPREGGGASNTYFCDYFYTPGLISAWRAWLRGGDAYNGGAFAGFGCLNASGAAGVASYPGASIGARLCYLS